MANIVKSCDFPKYVAVQVFKMLNHGLVELVETHSYVGTVIVTDIAPKDLIYPEGWYYAKGSFRNKHTSTTGKYDEVLMRRTNGRFWGDIANYCTLE